MYFAIAFFTIALAGALISARTLCGYNQISPWWKIFVFLLIFFCWLTPVLMRALRGQAWLASEIYGKISLIGYFLFGFVFILLMLLLARDILWGGAYGIARLTGTAKPNWSPLDVALLTKVNAVTLGFAFLFSLGALYAGIRTPAVKEVEIRTPKTDREIRIVQINDMHIDRSKPVKWFADMVDRVNSLNADIVVMPGDIIDDNMEAVQTQADELKRLKSRYGIYYSPGNHEFYNGIVAIQWYLQKIGVVWLAGNGVNVAGLPLYVAGVPDIPVLRKQAGYEHILDNAFSDSYKILLAHNPTLAREYLARGFDLQLSAHTHGGQIFPFHIPVKIVNNYLAGMYDLPEGKLYISRGAGYWGPPLRLLAPSDITLIRLLPEKQVADENRAD